MGHNFKEVAGAKTKTFVEFLYAGLADGEEKKRQVATRDVKDLKIPAQAYGFTFVDQNGKSEENRSNRYLVVNDASKVASQKDVNKFGDAYDLEAKMKKDGIQFIAKGNDGYERAVEATDTVIDRNKKIIPTKAAASKAKIATAAPK